MDRLSEHQYRTLEAIEQAATRDLREATGREDIVARFDARPVVVLEPTCRHCGYDVDDDGNCAFCGETTLPS